MQDLSSTRRVVLCGSSSTPGADAVDAILTTATTDIVYPELISSSVIPGRDTISLPRQRSTRAGHKTVSRPGTVPVNASGPLTGRNADGVPDYKPFLLAAMLRETAQDASSATYKPWTNQQDEMTIYEFIRELTGTDWRLRYATGVRGTLTINLTQGGEATWTFAGEGLYQGLISDPAAFFADDGSIALLKDGATSVTARSGGAEERAACDEPMICQGMTVTFDSVSMPVSDLEISFNVDLSIKRVMTGQTSNAVEVRGTTGNDGAITGSMTLMDGADAHDKAMDAWESDLLASLVVVLTEGDGGSGSERITITAPQTQMGDFSEGDSEGAMTHTLPLRMNGDCDGLADGSDLSIVYDAVS